MSAASGTKNPFAGNKSHDAAELFLQGILPKDDVSYRWIWDYAKELWAYRLKVYGMLDEKAEAIIKYLGGGAGLFALGVLAKVDKDSAYLVWWSLPALLSALAAVFLATLAKMPRFSGALPSVEIAVENAEEFKEEDKAKAVFLGQWHLSSERVRLACEKKAWLIKGAMWFYFGALACLVLPVVIAAWRFSGSTP